jgi:23S rRNA pseudouridine1911/1915/1917 synthase
MSAGPGNSILFETVAEQNAPRLDQLAAAEFELFTRSQFKQRVTSATLNGRPAKASSTVRAGDRIVIEYLPEAEFSMAGEDIPLEILFENDEVLVVNKARGMVVHPGAGNPSGTLVNAFVHHCGIDAEAAASTSGTEAFRPGIVHRLDKDTSGVIILAKTSAALEELSRQFRERQTRKSYLALADGALAGSGVLEGYIRRGDINRVIFIHDPRSGKYAESAWTVLASSPPLADRWPRGLTALRLDPKTGRTHQLRVHCRQLGAPILGDPLYNSRFAAGKAAAGIPLMLHAWKLTIRIPGETTARTFVADVPDDFCRIAREAGILDEILAAGEDRR